MSLWSDVRLPPVRAPLPQIDGFPLLFQPESNFQDHSSIFDLGLWFSNLNVPQHHSEGLLKQRLPDPRPRISDLPLIRSMVEPHKLHF